MIENRYTRPGTIEILLVEDNPADVDLVKEALLEWKILNNTIVIEDGVEAMLYLRRVAPYTQAIRPDLILLDLNLPRKDGRQVLEEIKSDHYLKLIPIIVLSSSDADMDVLKTYNLGGNCYIVKPMGIQNFINVIGSISDFWFSVVKLPSRDLLQSYRQNMSNVAVKKDLIFYPKELLRILIVEDNVADSDFIKEILSEQNKPTYEVVSCENIRQAMDLLSYEVFDCILLDLGLPDSTGLETYSKLVSKFPSQSIVITTDLDNDQTARTAIRRGAHDYIIKNQIEGHLLSRVIQYSIERRWADQERNTLIMKEQSARAEAEKAILARDEFLGIASHELKTPLTSLRLQSQMFSRVLEYPNWKEIFEKNKRLFRIFDKQTERLSKLVDNLLDISRINAGRLLLEYDDVDLSEVVEDTLQRFEKQLAESKCVVSFQKNKVIGKWDRFRIEQAFTNLLTNAMKYGASTPIEIKITQEGEIGILTIQDHGIGIKKENISQVFGKFERFVRPSEFSGLGLGLYITRQIIDAHRGKISVESEPGKGSKFTIELPLKLRTKQSSAA